MPAKRISSARKSKPNNKRRVTRKPMFDVGNVLWWTVTFAAVAVMLGILLQVVFPPKSKDYTAPAEKVSSTSESSQQAMWTGYNVVQKEDGKRMMYDEEGVLRDADEIRIDDLGRPIWVGGGLRRSDI